MADLYANYAQLAANEQIGVEYDIRPVWTPGTSWTSIAIHGGGIEPGTSEIAEAVAGSTMRFYEFDSHVTSGSNTDLHITSANFDEPQCVAMVTNADRCLSFHGYTGTTGVAETLIGGNDDALQGRVMRALQAAGFTVTVASSEYPGTDPLNICNRTRLSAGVQLEMSRTLRESFFTDFTRNGRKNPANRTTAFNNYVAAIQSVTVQRGAFVSMGSVNVSRWTLLPGSADVDLVATFSTDRLAAGGSEFVALVGRWVDASNCYLARVELSATQQVILTLRVRSGGSDSVPSGGTFTSPLTHTADGLLSARMQITQTTLRAKVWAAASPQPDWQITVTDGTFTAAGQMGLRFILSSAYTGALPVTATVKSFSATALPSLLLASTVDNGVWTTDTSDMPLDIRVGGERVTASAIAPAAVDAFGRTVASGWGNADSGQAWAFSGGVAADYSVASGLGQISHGSVNVLRNVTLPVAWTDVDLSVDVSWLIGSAVGAPVGGWLIVGSDLSNYYVARAELTVAGTVSVTLLKRVGGSLSGLPGATATAGANTAGDVWRLRLTKSGTQLTAQVTNSASGTASAAVTATDTAIPAGSMVGVVSRLESGNTNTLPVVVRFDNLVVANPQIVTLSARAVNGVVRAWPAGTDVDVWQPAITAL